jgi:hypothetical protein
VFPLELVKQMKGSGRQVGSEVRLGLGVSTRAVRSQETEVRKGKGWNEVHAPETPGLLLEDCNADASGAGSTHSVHTEDPW